MGRLCLSKKNLKMTKEEIEDYLYFFWAPLLQAGEVSDDDMEEFQKRIILAYRYRRQEVMIMIMK